MRFRLCVVALLMFLFVPSAIVPSEAEDGAGERRVPRLADIMSSVQLRHIKLWFAGVSSNWELAAYELRRLKTSLAEAAALYPGIPVTNITMMVAPVDAVAGAINAKDRRAFESNFRSLTDGCNTCHQSMERSYIVMRVPSTSPFSDQDLSPPGKRQEKR